MLVAQSNARTFNAPEQNAGQQLGADLRVPGIPFTNERFDPAIGVNDLDRSAVTVDQDAGDIIRSDQFFARFRRLAESILVTLPSRFPGRFFWEAIGENIRTK
jgi:hypothetical protein